MATTQAKVNPKKKSSGFQGVKNASFIILVCFVLAGLFFKYILGAPEHFVNGDPTQPVKDGNLMGTVYKGGVVVPVIITLLFSVIALSIERFFALRTAFGKSSLGKFVINVKQAITAGDMAKAQQLCDKQQGSVQQAHEEATQLEMPTLQMNMPIVATIVTLGTLTALFGTVVGMIRSFAALASGGGGDSLQLSEGISEALVNTASGILTSWVAVVSYNYYSNKIDKLTYALDEVGYTIAKTYEANHADEA